MAGLGFKADESSAFKNKQGKSQDMVAAVAQTDVGKNLANSPAAKAVEFVGRNAVAGTAAIPFALMDVANEVGNVVNWALGGDPNYFRTDNTQQVLQAANPSPAAAPAIAGVAKPVAAAAATNAVDPRLAAVQAKDAAITNTPTRITPDAGLTQSMVQRPVSAVQPIAGNGVVTFDAGKQIPFVGNASSLVAGKETKVGGDLWTRGINGKPYQLTGVNDDGTRFDNRVSLKSGAQLAHEADLAQIAKTGRTVAEQRAVMDRIQKDSDRYSALNMSPREAAAFATMNNSKASSYMRAAAAAEVEAFKSRRDAFLGKEKSEQAQAIAGMKEQGDKYKVDQDLAGKKYAADAAVKAQEIAGVAATSKAAIAAGEKQKEAQQKDYADRVKSMVGEWSKLNLPKEYVPKLNQFAKIYAAAEDPESNVFMMAPNRENGMYAALPKQYEAAYTRLLQTMPHKDAAARIYQIAQKQGHAVDVPDFKRFLPTSEAIKQQQNTVIAGVQ